MSLDWAGGLVWLEVPPTQDAADATSSARCVEDGHATLIRAPERCASAVEVFQPAGAGPCRAHGARQGLLRPAPGLFNPGRMYRGI